MNKLFQRAISYKLTVAYFLLFSVNALSAAIIASFLNTDWSALSNTSKFILIVVVIQNWTGTMLAFLYTTKSRVDKGESIIPTDKTQTT